MHINTQNQTGGMRYSRIEEHNIHRDTDKLYDPLRGVLLHPENSAIHSNLGYQAQRTSQLHDPYHSLTPQEAERIVR